MNTILTDILLLMNLLYILDENIITLLNYAIPLATSGLFPDRVTRIVEDMVASLKVKFEGLTLSREGQQP
jgi:hypothetical protein